VLQFSPDGDEALHWKPYLFSADSIYQVNGLWNVYFGKT